MGSLAPIVMSVVVFSGAAQFAALSVLAAGGAAGAAIVAGVLMNLRFLPMGFAIGPSLPGRAAARGAQGQTIVDASFVMASRGDGSFDRGRLFGATAVQAAGGGAAPRWASSSGRRCPIRRRSGSTRSSPPSTSPSWSPRRTGGGRCSRRRSAPR
jgi:hypothetical protein